MNLPIRQDWKSGLLTAIALLGVLLALVLGLTPAAAQTHTITGTAAITHTTAPVAATTATTVTVAIPASATRATTGVTAVVTATATSNQKPTTPTRNPNLPLNILTGVVPTDNPSDVVPDLNLTPGPLTPAAPTPPPAVDFSQDKAPLGSWPVTIALVLIVLGVAWGAYQFLRKPAVLPADAEGDMLVKVTPPDEPKAVAPLTNQAATMVDTTKPEAQVVADTVAGAAAAGAVAAGAAAAAPENVTCSNCGTVNPWDELHCTNCGAALDADKQNALAEGVAAAAAAPTVIAPVVAPSVAAAPPVAQPLDLPDEQLPYLETLSRADEQLEYVLDRTYITIGRARTNDIVIDNSFVGWQTVSPYHAELRYQNGKFVLVDKQSDNGSFVNRVRTGSNVLEDGMSLSFGKVEFIYRQPAR